MMKKQFTVYLFFVLISLQAWSQNLPEITAGEIQQHINYLASESLKGRKPGTPEGDMAAGYIGDQFTSYGLTLVGDEGMQYFELVADVQLGENNSFMISNAAGQVNEDFIPLPFTGNAKLGSPVVFVDYGFDIENDSVKWNSYNNLDVKGKWVLILRGSPDSENKTGKYEGSVDERTKVILAKDKGAAGVIFVSGEKFDKDDHLLKLSYDKSIANAGIPVIQIKRTLAELIFAGTGKSLTLTEEQVINDLTPQGMDINVKVTAQTDVRQIMVRTQNVIALLETNLKTTPNRYIVIGAHYDHLGYGGSGSGSRMPDTVAVHYGADDNASGVSGMLELAEFLVSQKDKLGCSIIFVAFGAEEMGLVGSKYFVANPPVPLNEIVAMINFDMIGRLKDSNAFTVGGTGTSAESEGILNDLAKSTSLEVKYSPEGYGPSDHAAFYTNNIPVFYFTTGAHEDYHTPFDNAERINGQGEESIVKFAGELVLKLSSLPGSLTFTEAGPKEQTRQGYNFKVTFGIMPDVASSDTTGLNVDGVRKGGPADIAGMRKGDKIIAIDGNSVGNIYDYMARLKKLETGQRVSVDVIRQGKKEVLIVQL